jgi:hypothetical protein
MSQYLGATLTNQNFIREEISSSLKSGNAYYPGVKTVLSSSLLSKNIKLTMYRTVILPVVLYGCETWSLALRKEHRLRVSENRELRRIIGPKREELTGEWRGWRSEELYSPNITRAIKSRRKGWAGHVAFTVEKRGA